MKFFKAKNRVRMHDTDAAGILYFPRQFRFCHDAFEDLFDAMGFSYKDLFHNLNFSFVVVHAESDYKVSLVVGDKLDVHIHLVKIGTTSLTFAYEIFKEGAILTGSAKTVHVCIDRKKRVKMPVPQEVIAKLKDFF